jgi:TonB family protein
MALPVWIENLIAYSLQMAILAASGTLLAHVFRLRIPRVSLIYWQTLLLGCLLLPALQKWEHPAAFPSFHAVETTAIPIPSSGAISDSMPVKILPVMETIVIILVSGAVLRLIWLVLGFLRLSRLLNKSKRLDEAPAITDRISSLIRVQARFFLSNEIDSPATFGILKPIVLLPGSFHKMSEACREAVVYHELLHIRRRDWALILAEEIVRTIFWFHPAVWWLLSRIHLTREQSVDQEVVKLTGNQKPYLDSLIEIARMHGRPKAFPAPLFLRERHLVQRVALLLKEVSMNRTRLVLSLSGIAILLTGTVRLASGWFPLTGPALVVQEEISAEEIESQQIPASPATPADLIPTPTAPTPTVPQQRIRLKQSNGMQSNVKLQLSFWNGDLTAFILQMSDFLGLSPLIIDPEVQGTVTTQSSEPMSKSEALALFHQILKTNNATLIEQNGIYQVVPKSSDLKTGIDPIENQAPDVESGTTPENSATSPPREGGMDSGIVGKVPGGIVGGRVGGIEVETPFGPVVPPPKPAPAEAGGIVGGIVGGKPGVAIVDPKQFVSGAIDPPQQAPPKSEIKTTESRLIRRVDPVYPELAKRARVQGQVVLKVTVDEEGSVGNAEVLRGHPLLKDSAVAAVKQWKYEPTIINGAAVTVTATVTINFVLPGDQTMPSQAGAVPRIGSYAADPEINDPLDSPDRIASTVRNPRLIKIVDPVYPELAKRARVQGQIVLKVTVDEEGRIRDVEVLSGHPLLSDSAVAAVKQWIYEPTIINGAAVPVTATVTINFVLPVEPNDP